MAEGSTDSDCKRTTYGFVIVIVGLFVVSVVYIAAIMRFSAVGDVTAVVGTVTGLIGTIIGAFFGIQVGAEGKNKEMEARKEAEVYARQISGYVEPSRYEEAMESIGKKNF